MGYIQDLISQGYTGYQGWNDEAAVRADFNATGGSGKYHPANSSSGSSGSSSSSSGGAFNIVDYAKQLLGFQQQANKPAIQSLQAGIPEVQSTIGAEKTRLEGEKQPLTARYEQLVRDVTGRTEMATAQEFGRRGIPTTSGLLEKTLAEKISPETERIGLAKEADIRGIDEKISGLTGIETEKIREIRNAIAQLEAGDSSGAIGNALNMAQLGESTRQFNVGAELQKLQAEKVDTSTITAGGRVLLVNNQTGQTIKDLGSSLTGTDKEDMDATSSAINTMISSAGGDKSKVWQWIHQWEPEFKKQGVDSSRLWALYNNM